MAAKHAAPHPGSGTATTPNVVVVHNAVEIEIAFVPVSAGRAGAVKTRKNHNVIVVDKTVEIRIAVLRQADEKGFVISSSGVASRSVRFKQIIRRI